LITAKTWKNGFENGLKTAFMLLKVILPVFALIKVLEHTPVIGWISKFCDPLMQFVGLPGEAALAVVTGMFLNFYAAIGIIIALGLSAWQVTIIGVILSCCHELVIETAIIKKTGIRAWPILGLRMAAALGAGITLNLFGKLAL
jgi:hypothetical protein